MTRRLSMVKDNDEFLPLTRCFTCKCPCVEWCVTSKSLFSTSHVYPFSIWFHCSTIFIYCSLVWFSPRPMRKISIRWAIDPFKRIRSNVVISETYPLFAFVWGEWFYEIVFLLTVNWGQMNSFAMLSTNTFGWKPRIYCCFFPVVVVMAIP